MHEVKPPLPHDFRQRLIPANMLLAQHAVVQKVQEEPEKEDDPEAAEKMSKLAPSKGVSQV